MARVRQTRDETRRTVVSRLDWRSARRDDQTVAQAIHAGAGIDAIYNLDEAGLLDAFYHFLAQIGFLGLLGGLGLPGVKRVLLPVFQFVLLYLLKTLYGIASMNALPPLLFSNVALMRLSGFNARQIGHGLTRRGDAAGGRAAAPTSQTGPALAAVPGGEHLQAGRGAVGGALHRHGASARRARVVSGRPDGGARWE